MPREKGSGATLVAAILALIMALAASTATAQTRVSPVVVPNRVDQRPIETARPAA